MTRAKRLSTTKKLIASTGLVGGALALAFGGAFASFTDTVSGSPEAVASGTVSLNAGTVNDSGVGATGIVPGDTIAREIDIAAGATPPASITLGFNATLSSLLDSDPTNGLQVSVQDCASQPGRVTTTTPYTYTCTPGWTTVPLGGASSTSVAALETTPVAMTGLKALTANGKDYLLMTLTFPSTAPGDLGKVTTACSGTRGGSATTENLEGCSSTLVYNMIATQRAAGAQ